MKKSVRYLLSALALSAAAACGGGGGDDNAKNLFSTWRNEATNAPLALDGASFNTPLRLMLYTTNGGQCNCDATIVGDQVSGRVIVNSCTPQVGTTATFAGCSVLDGFIDYSNVEGVLTLTRDNITARFR